MVTSAAPKASFKEKMLQVREDAIILAVNRLLAEKGFEAMTVDAVAAEVGIAKASLYKHFPSKEDLAAAAMVAVMGRAQAFLDSVPGDVPPLERLRRVVAWTMRAKLDGEMPFLPSQHSGLRRALLGNAQYVAGLANVSARLTGWIAAAQAQGAIHPGFAPNVVLYTLYARACDPVLEFLQMDGVYSDDEIVSLVLATCFNGLAAR